MQAGIMGDWLNCTLKFKADAIGISRKDGEILKQL